MKTYLGTRLPNPIDGAIDTAQTTIVLVIDHDLSSDGEHHIAKRYDLPHVCVTGSALGKHWRTHFGCHSPTGLNWGYGGSGPSELAAMILLDLGLQPDQAWQLHQAFKRQFVVALDDTWALHEKQLSAWVEAMIATADQFISDPA